ncbi:MAG: hypothetical protein IKB73_01300 [Ruminococcus sp.]|nr:hypothetical protein [Ruminococcus sp.]
MKKLTLIILAIMMCVMFASCAKEEVNNDDKSSTTHTIPASESVNEAEPEWAEIDCDMTLVDAQGNIVLSGSDFETFALVGTNDDDSYILIKTSQEATDIVKTADPSSTLDLCINGNTVGGGSISPSEFNGEIKLGEDMTYETLCELANSIRGLF